MIKIFLPIARTCLDLQASDRPKIVLQKLDILVTWIAVNENDPFVDETGILHQLLLAGLGYGI